MTQLMTQQNLEIIGQATDKDKIRALELKLFAMPQADIVTTHTFLPGKYERKIVVPPWTVLTGAEHRVPYTVRLESGTIAVTTDDGVKILTGPCEFEAPAGTQRAGRVFDEEVVWVDVYNNPDDCQNIAELENRLYVVPEYGLADNRTTEQKIIIETMVYLDKLKTNQAQMTYQYAPVTVRYLTAI
jgi:hypothetical protein